MNYTKKKLLQARWLLVSGIMFGTLGLTGCGTLENERENAYEAVKNDDNSEYSYYTGFYKDGDEYKLFYSRSSIINEEYYDYETGEFIGKYFLGLVVDDEKNIICYSDQFIKFKSLDKNLDYSYEEAFEITDEMFDNMFKNFSKNIGTCFDNFDVFEISNIETGEDFYIIGERLYDNTFFNLETYKVEDYNKCIVKKVEDINIKSGNTRDAFLKKFYEKYYPEKLEEQETQITK